MHRFHIEFIGRKWLWFSISGSIIAVGIIAMLLGGLKWGVEFQGGNQFDVAFKKATSVAEIRKVLVTLKLGNSTIQSVGGSNEYLIRTPRLSANTRTEVTAALKKDFQVKDISTRDIGPGWGSQVTDGAVKALIASLLMLLLYISIRYDFKMAVAAIVSLVHDGVIVLGVYATVGLIETKLGLNWLPTEVTPNTVAALLTILGFSLYDTIVVFHRIRENAEHIGKRTYSRMANDSINQVLMRSINTSSAELIPIIALLFFGGETLKDFAFAMLLGLIAGAYSSIFIASPILAMWKETEERYRLIKQKLTQSSSRANARDLTQPQAKKVEAQKLDSKDAAPGTSSTSWGEGRGEGGAAEIASPAEGQPSRNDANVTPTSKQLSAAQKAKKKKKKKRR